MSEVSVLRRRAFLAGTAASGALALTACATPYGGFSFVDAVQRLLFLASQRAFDRMARPGGFWDQEIERLGLANFVGGRGDALTRVLTSALFKSRLQRAFADIAWRASERAAPVVADTIRVVGYQNAIDIVRGGPTAATGYLRSEMGNRLIDVMAPDVGQLLRVAQDPLVGQLLGALTGVDIPGLAAGFSAEVNDVIWREIGREEAAIRADPAGTRDRVLMGVFGPAPRY
jgi:hypothetical protein